MRWPWSDRVDHAEAKAKQAEERAERIESQWDFINAQLRRLREHRAENGFTQKIHRVARGSE